MIKNSMFLGQTVAREPNEIKRFVLRSEGHGSGDSKSFLPTLWLFLVNFL